MTDFKQEARSAGGATGTKRPEEARSAIGATGTKGKAQEISSSLAGAGVRHAAE